MSLARALARLGVVGAVTISMLALAGPAGADTTVTPPATVVAKQGATIIVQLDTPEGYVCETDWKTSTAGTTGVVDVVSDAACDLTLASWAITVGNARKGTATVTFTKTSADGATESATLTVVVKPPKKAKPSKKPKPGTGQCTSGPFCATIPGSA